MASTSTTTIRRRRLRSSPDNKEPLRYFRPRHIDPEVHELFERKDLTENEIFDFCAGTALPAPNRSGQEQQHLSQVETYRAKRQEIHELVQKLRTGGARVDEDGRLVAVNHQQQQQPLPPVGVQAVQQPPPPPVQRQPPVPNADDNIPILDNEDEERQLIEQEEREAAAAIARAVQRYREHGVDMQDLELVRVQQGEETINNRLTFRRICFAVLAVAAAFVFILMQNSVLVEIEDEMSIDKLMYKVLHVRHLEEHAKECPSLNRQNNLTWRDQLEKLVRWSNKTDCSDGVLHLPGRPALFHSLLKSKSAQGLSWSQVVQGLNVSWFFPCQEVSGAPSPCYYSRPATEGSDVCTLENENSCFRGVHDDLVFLREVDDALKMGENLISMGGDHFDIHYNVSVLKESLPSLLEKLCTLLRGSYHVEGDLQPVAFRVSAVGPMDGDSVPLHGALASYPLPRILNRTRYRHWVHKSMRRNEVAQFSLPWPFRISPVRDSCNLMADMEADPRFAIHTTIFLSDGGGHDFHGGVALYVDDHPSKRPRRKIRRGLTIDGSIGRIVVSTGGLENRRCRLPTRAGIRAALQIWWTC